MASNRKKVDSRAVRRLVRLVDSGPVRQYLLYNLLGISIDGTDVTDIQIDGQPVQEVTVDGSKVWSAVKPIHDFNDTTNIGDYSGDTSYFSVDTNSPSLLGNNSLKFNNPGSANLRIISTSGLPNYPQAGDTFASYVRERDGSGAGPVMIFGLQDYNNFYGAEFFPGGGRIGIYKDGTTSGSLVATSSVSLSSQTWYDLEVRWGTGGGITVEVYDIDSNGNRQSGLQTVSTNDSSYSGGGFGWGSISSSGDAAYDYARILS